MDPRILPPFFRPQKTPCQAPAIAYGDSALPAGRGSALAGAPGTALNTLLDTSNAGTYSEARRNALLGRGNEGDTMRAIAGLARAAEDGRLDENVAGRRIAELAEPPVAGAEFGQFATALTAAQLAERRRLAKAGASNSAVELARAAKMAEACRARVCYMSGDPKTGRIDAANNVDISAAQAMALKNFVRFCTPEETARFAGPPPTWGEWLVDRVRRTAATVGLAQGPQPMPFYSVPLPPSVPTPAPGVPGGYLCMDPRVLPPAFRPQDYPCVPPQIAYPG